MSGAILKSQEPRILNLDSLILEDVNYWLSRNVGEEFASVCCVMPQKSADIVYFVGEAWMKH